MSTRNIPARPHTLTDADRVAHVDGPPCRPIARLAGERRKAIPLVTLDHVIEWAAGGCDHAHNLRVLCSSCNPSIGNRGRTR